MTEEEQNPLPSSWVECNLGDVLLDIVGGGTPPKDAETYFQGDIPLMTVKDMKHRRPTGTGFNITEDALANSNARMIPSDTVIIATRMGLGKVVRASFDTAINQDLKALFAPPELDKSFLEFWLMSVASKIESMGAGTTVKGVRLDAVRSLEFPLAPFNEQLRIVERIETLFAQLDKGEESVREVQKLLTRYRQSILQSAVTGQLTADWRGQHEGRQEEGGELLDRVLATRCEQWPSSGNYRTPVEPPVEDLPELPRGWAWASVDQLLRAGLSNGRSVPGADGPGFPVMRLTALKDGVIDTSERKEGRWTREEAKPFLVEQGDILVSRGNGSKQLVGRGGLIADPVDPVAYPDTMIRLPISLDHLLPQWFVQLWNSPYMRAQIEKAAKTTAGIYKINQGDIRSFVVPLPPLEEQEQIASAVAEEINKTTDLERWCVSELKRSTSLRQSILKEAFAGRLVPQDPTDGPASDLLALIAADKAPIKKTRRKVQA